MALEPVNKWLLQVSDDVIANLDLIVSGYELSPSTALTGIMEYILNGESDLMDFMCDEYFTNSQSLNDLMYLIDCIQQTCGWAIESIGDHYERIPTTFTVSTAILHPNLQMLELNIQGWRV